MANGSLMFMCGRSRKLLAMFMLIMLPAIAAFCPYSPMRVAAKQPVQRRTLSLFPKDKQVIKRHSSSLLMSEDWREVPSSNNDAEVEDPATSTVLDDISTGDRHSPAEAIVPGTWVLESEMECEETTISCKFQDKFIITLDENGTFKAAIEPRKRCEPWQDYFLDPRHYVKGVWSKKINHPVSELVLHVERRAATGKQDRFFVGKRDSKNAARVVGSVLEGLKDPVFVGTFSLTLIMRSFSSLPVLKANDNLS